MPSQLEQDLIQLLHTYEAELGNVFPFDLNTPKLLVFDLSDQNNELKQMDFTHETSFSEYVSNKMAEAHTPVAIGKYNEDRIIYRQSENFQGVEARSIHLGIDLWATAGTYIFSPLDGIVHSFADNKGFGNYGPTLILQHFLDDVTFYTLYGHLDHASLTHLQAGKAIQKGETIGALGTQQENGGWPPHLHFQICSTILEISLELLPPAREITISGFVQILT
ncbi:peptidoglycan DD-metalloendopeptidase family protein [Rhodocytophaga rosea]|uniref:peptidoglycan DD-metalloendopeptidase family protein n=1 Tax=Rhodocytophaga rosea TaxID=2704465 RepID=UPI001E43399C|nr:peptidoglycan DD-metalloendopeptidase family protein [Rhodocytophaga rosea]